MEETNEHTNAASTTTGAAVNTTLTTVGGWLRVVVISESYVIVLALGPVKKWISPITLDRRWHQNETRYLTPDSNGCFLEPHHGFFPEIISGTHSIFVLSNTSSTR